MRLGGQTITVTNGVQNGVGRLGKPAFTETVTTWHGCSVQTHQTRRHIELTDVFEARARLFAPTAVPLTAGYVDTSVSPNVLHEPSKVSCDGIDYIVDGDPEVWKGPSGRPHHIECYLRELSG